MNIILLVGPSGSGKDSLLRLARQELESNTAIAFARRYITRPPDRSEDNYYIETIGFAHLETGGFFLSTWQAHGNRYGIANHLFRDQQPYTTLICSVSRSVIGDFEKKNPHATTIEITVSQDALRNRLKVRGREQSADIDKRLKRANQPVIARNLHRFDNSVPLEKSGPRFIALLKSLIPGECQIDQPSTILQANRCSE